MKLKIKVKSNRLEPKPKPDEVAPIALWGGAVLSGRRATVRTFTGSDGTVIYGESIPVDKR